jgi:hypothetical protein
MGHLDLTTALMYSSAMNYADVNTSLSLEQLEGQSWGDVATAPTKMVKRCIMLSKIPLKELTAGDLRLLVGQQLSLIYLLPLALRLLETYPLLRGELYEGDLLNNVLTVDWSDPSIREHLPCVIAIAKRAHLQMMHEATEDLLQGHAPEEFGLTDSAYDKVKRNSIESIVVAPWDALVNFLEIHG